MIVKIFLVQCVVDTLMMRTWSSDQNFQTSPVHGTSAGISIRICKENLGARGRWRR